MKTVISIGLSALLGASAASAASTPVPMNDQAWEIGGEAGWLVEDGEPTLRLGPRPGQPLSGGEANLKGVDFATGVIEFDLKLVGERDFAGPAFHIAATEGGGQGELLYLRPHMNGKPDAMQYTPIVNDSWAWQIFTGEGFESNVNYPLNRWMHVRVDVYESSAQVSIDGRPALHIPHLMSDQRSGKIVLAAAGGAQFRHFAYERIAGYSDPRPIAPHPALPAGTVGRWQVSQAMTEEEGFRRAAASDWNGLAWTAIASEHTGAANLSKAGPDGGDRHTYIARFQAESAAAATAKMEFGFSDQVRLFVNGAPLYEGADLQDSRDYRFLGHVGFWDALFVPLNAGTNEIAFVVTDGTNGGTAAAARFVLPEVVRIVP